MVRWVVGSILHGRLIELFLVPPSAPRLVKQRLRYVLSFLWDDAYKRTLAGAAAGFLSRYLSGPLPYV